MDGKERNTKVESNTHSLQGKYTSLRIAPFLFCLCLFLITFMYQCRTRVQWILLDYQSIKNYLSHSGRWEKRKANLSFFLFIFCHWYIYMYIIQHACLLIY